MKRTSLLRVAAFSAIAAVGCADVSPSDWDQDAEGEDASESSLYRDLALGSEGADVAVVQRYLGANGYLPNQDLADRYPSWRPIVDEKLAQPGVFDAATERAVRELQVRASLPETGVVDAATRELMGQPRCGVPDGIGSVDQRSKFALQPAPWTKRNITWRVTNTDDNIPIADVRAAASTAFSSWAGNTSLTFTQVTSGQDITISFGQTTSSTALAEATTPANSAGNRDASGVPIVINTAYSWSTAATVVSPNQDVQAVLIHEIGHALGLAHSSFANAMMLPTVSRNRRVLALDDATAISARYDQWNEVFANGGGVIRATDIASGGIPTGGVWAIGTGAVPGGGQIWKLSGSSWELAPGGAVRIAVAPGGIPWIVNSIGKIFRRTSASASSGTWEVLPGCAKDIGAGQDGSVWVIGCSAVAGGFAIHKWNGSNWDFVPGGATRISVGPTGLPWLVNSVGSVFRRTSSSAFSGSWETISGPGSASDIAVGWHGGATWIVGFAGSGSGLPIYVWNEQPAITSAPAKREWIYVPGITGTSIAVGSQDRPWITNSAGQVMVQVR